MMTKQDVLAWIAARIDVEIYEVRKVELYLLQGESTEVRDFDKIALLRAAELLLTEALKDD